MSDNAQMEPTPAKEGQPEKAGDIIRKERISKRITIETIARDLRINAKYLKSLEASQYDELPADPYVRVYLRSLAKYLMIDTEDILKRYYRDRGILASDEIKTSATSKIEIRVQKETHPKLPLPLIIGIIVLLAVIGFIAGKKGFVRPVSDQPAAPDSVKVQEKADSLQNILKTIGSSDSLQAEQNSPVPETIDSTPPPAIKTDSLKLSIKVLRDSVWVQVFSDGKSWKATMHQSAVRQFTAVDSFNVHVGNNSLVHYFIDGKQTSVIGGGVVFFKLDRNGVFPWTQTQWKQIFNSRL